MPSPLTFHNVGTPAGYPRVRALRWHEAVTTDAALQFLQRFVYSHESRICGVALTLK